ncbi:hypothetical protein SAMN02745216_00813 [Desulfatibacillum alkenivorans DSM 16219]|jgi:hypothetical protein|uniref:Uncharacterized protein n=1 Tax=Desulfatibacillum alkenivorans DSM 16219 TaxID=1121393 RepID=A0A1M6FG97_9BACT|nr:hypothetical protein [Desulfatibacillum alkenivorans]SHI96689.1 hypothetical protein SAMN02745216_00813 [Desulfatibacillum alkenivorans DSM 16219]
MENDWNVEWNLDLPRDEAAMLLRQAIESVDEKTSTEYRPSAGEYVLWLGPKRVKKYAQGKIKLLETENGSLLSAVLSVRAPYRYASFDVKKISY